MASTRIFGNRCRALMAAAKTSTAASATTKTSVDDAAPPKTRSRPQGILKPQPISPAFHQFVDMPKVSRSDAVKIVWDYIKEQKLQGRDKDCILVAFVRSSENPRNCSSSLLGDWHRINVAITRAKKKLIMVGSCRTLSKVPLLKLLIERVEDQSGILSISEKEIKLKPELKRCSYTTS